MGTKMGTKSESYDRAVEWVNEHHPELEGAAWERFVAEVEADLRAIDDAADAEDTRASEGR